MANLEVLKTYKIYIGGQFPRTESGRYYALKSADGKTIANMCLSSRKDFRNAVQAARNAFAAWSSKTHFNRSQILYRIAEMLQGRKAQFVAELILQGSTKSQAEKEVQDSIERCIYYCGWCDKYQQLFSTVNPVASSHFNFSVCEPAGVVAIIAPENASLLGIISVVLPVIAGGNTCVVLASETQPLCAVTLSEVLATSDLSGGVVNIMTGRSKELHTHFASHMDVNTLIYCRTNSDEEKAMSQKAALNVKRYLNWSDWNKEDPYLILDAQEIKTTWHPIEQIGAGGAKY